VNALEPRFHRVRPGCFTLAVRNAKRSFQTLRTSALLPPGGVLRAHFAHHIVSAHSWLRPLGSDAIRITSGVLTAPSGARGRIDFDPPLPLAERAMQGLAMGAAVRVSLQLDEPFWDSPQFARRHGTAESDAMAFVFSQSPAAFPVWWTPYPVRSPLLVGWCGGPAAWTLSRESPDAVVDAAIRSAATLFGLTRRTMSRRVRAAFTHDWSNDPFSRGCYSYPRVSGDRAAAALARPIRNTVYFAGEHTADRGRNGTVDGAIASGWRVGERVVSEAEVR
jgi:monoamine oxidase